MGPDRRRAALSRLRSDREACGRTRDAVVMPLVVLVCGALVLYPDGFLIDESLNVGDPRRSRPSSTGSTTRHEPD